MLNARTKIIVVGFLLALTGCDKSSKVTALENKLSVLETELTNLKQKVELEEMVSGWDKVAHLTPGAEGYSLIKSDLGNLTVPIVNVSPYANGPVRDFV